MPNWCFSDVYIHGPENEIDFLHNKIKKLTSKNATENSFGLNWLGNIVLNSGFKSIDEDEEEGFECRGVIDYYNIENKNILHIQTETAWKPMNRIWLALINFYAPNCKLHYIAEEPGCCIYEKYEDETDAVKFFDKIDYNIEVCLESNKLNLTEEEFKFLSHFINAHEYETNELLNLINNFLKNEDRDPINENGIEIIFKELDEKIRNEDDYVCINKYEEIAIEEIE